MKKIVLYLLLAFIVIQFYPLDRTNEPVDEKINFIDTQKPPQEVESLIKNACYDCHSNETKYPFYAYIAPFSWSVKHHINEGRENLNFSKWGNYPAQKKSKLMEECAEMIAEGEMPMKGYVFFHPEAKLKTVQKELLIQYFNQQSQSIQ